MRQSRWLSGGVALGVAVALFVGAFAFGGLAWLELGSADDRVAEQGWLYVSKARASTCSTQPTGSRTTSGKA